MDCPRFNHCNAPLCPLCYSPDQLWFPSEPICGRVDSEGKYPLKASNFWRTIVKAQKALRLRTKRKPEIKNFGWTPGMLYAYWLFRTRGIGINPDKGNFKAVVKDWFATVTNYPRKEALVVSGKNTQ